MAFAPYAWPLLALASFLVLLGTQKAWAASFGALLRQLANLIDDLPSFSIRGHGIGFGGVASAIRTADASVYHWIGLAIEASAQPFVTFIRYAADVIEKPAQQVALLTADLVHTVAQLRRVIVPAMIAAHVAWIPRHLIALEHQLAALPRVIPKVTTHIVTRVVPHVTRVTVAKAVTVTMPGLGRVEREAGVLGKRINSLAHRVSPAVLAGVVVATLARTVGGWVRCSRVKKVGRNVCGMDSDLLDSLLADTLLVVGTISLVELAEGLQVGMDTLAPQVRKFWRVTL